MANVLLIFTEQFPYGKSELFLQTELDYLAPLFDRIVVIPLIAAGQIKRVLPSNVAIDSSFALQRNRYGDVLSNVFRIVTSGYVYRELLGRWSKLLNLRAAKRFIRASLHSVQVQKWLAQFFKVISGDTKVVCYTYFLTGVTLGLGASKAKYHLKVASRGHGFDVYEDDYPGRYIPYQRQILATIDAFLPISQHVADHLYTRLGAFTHVSKVSRLGVMPLPFLCERSSKGTFSIVSCSNLIALKQIDKIIDGIALLAKANPQMKIVWNHFGLGPLHDALVAKAHGCLNNLVTWQIKYLDHAQVLAFYRDHAIDVFLNISTTEGLPVSIMEAYSCSIPAIATAVNGVPEIVNQDNGILLPINIMPTDVFNALSEFLNYSDALIEVKRQNALKMWQANFDARQNYTDFGQTLLALLA